MKRAREEHHVLFELHERLHQRLRHKQPVRLSDAILQTLEGKAPSTPLEMKHLSRENQDHLEHVCDQLRSPEQVRALMALGVTPEHLSGAYHRMIQVALDTDLALAETLLSKWTNSGFEYRWFEQVQNSVQSLELLLKHVDGKHCPEHVLRALIKNKDWAKVRLLAPAVDRATLRRAVVASGDLVCDATTLGVLVWNGVTLRDLAAARYESEPCSEDCSESEACSEDLFDIDDAGNLVPWNLLDDTMNAWVELGAANRPDFFVLWLERSKHKQQLLAHINAGCLEALWESNHPDAEKWMDHTLTKCSTEEIVESKVLRRCLDSPDLFRKVSAFTRPEHMSVDDLRYALHHSSLDMLKMLVDWGVTAWPMEAALRRTECLSFFKDNGVPLPDDEKFLDAVANCSMTFEKADLLLKWGLNPQVFRRQNNRLLRRAVGSRNNALTRLFYQLFKGEASDEDFYNQIFNQ